MGYFGAVFGRRGDAGFSGALLRATRGVVGFIVSMFLRPARELFRPARPGVGASAKKFALQAQNGRKTLFSGVLGEFFRGNAVGRGVLGEFCTAHAVRRGLPGEFYTAVARRGSCWASLVSSRHHPCHQLPAFRRPLHRGAARPGNLRRSRRPHSTFRTGGDGGFAALGGGWRRVAGVSYL